MNLQIQKGDVDMMCTRRRFICYAYVSLVENEELKWVGSERIRVSVSVQINTCTELLFIRLL